MKVRKRIVEKIFVFGSNLEGRHGKGAAKTALKEHGAIWGQGEGRQGNSYALPTKITPYKTMELEELKKHVKRFLNYARLHRELMFEITAVGTGLAGHDIEDVALLFKNAPKNCHFLDNWNKHGKT